LMVVLFDFEFVAGCAFIVFSFGGEAVFVTIVRVLVAGFSF
jgi:hypothetical protein